MKKDKLNESVNKTKETTKECLQMLYDSINKGQQKQIIKNKDIKDMFDRYGVQY